MEQVQPNTLKASPALEALITLPNPPAPTARPPTALQTTIDKIEHEATAEGLYRSSWLTIVTATIMTRGTPDSITALTHHILDTVAPNEVVETLEFMREVGMSCMVMNGIPRTLKMLTAFCASLPQDTRNSLSRKSTRDINEYNIASMKAQGFALWTQIHGRLSKKLAQKFREAHPDLPSVVIGTMYGNSLRNGRVTTSLGAIACLHAQKGFEPQVHDHVYGLKNAWRDGSWRGDRGIGCEAGMKWLLDDEGCLWVLEKVEELVRVVEQEGDDEVVRCRSRP